MAQMESSRNLIVRLSWFVGGSPWCLGLTVCDFLEVLKGGAAIYLLILWAHVPSTELEYHIPQICIKRASATMFLQGFVLMHV